MILPIIYLVAIVFLVLANVMLVVSGSYSKIRSTGVALVILSLCAGVMLIFSN